MSDGLWTLVVSFTATDMYLSVTPKAFKNGWSACISSSEKSKTGTFPSNNFPYSRLSETKNTSDGLINLAIDPGARTGRHDSCIISFKQSPVGLKSLMQLMARLISTSWRGLSSAASNRSCSIYVAMVGALMRSFSVKRPARSGYTAPIPYCPPTLEDSAQTHE